jgi:hypothetical protein
MVVGVRMMKMSVRVSGWIVASQEHGPGSGMIGKFI